MASYDHLISQIEDRNKARQEEWREKALARRGGSKKKKTYTAYDELNENGYSREYFDEETGQRMCVYMKPGRGAEDKVIPLSPSLQCQRSYTCPLDD